MKSNSSEPNDDGRPWGFIEDGVWRALPKLPMLLAGLGPPPFTVELPSGPREIVHEPERQAPDGD